MVIPKATVSYVFALALAVLLATLPVAANASGFNVAVDGMADDAMMTRDMGYDKMNRTNDRACGGTNKAPSLSWVKPPDKTQSYAVLELEPDGNGGMGVSHMVVYNIPPSATALSNADIATAKYTIGRRTGDVIGYEGPCPPLTDAPHHYIFTVYALDLAPALPAGLDRAGLLATMKGHVIEATTTVLRFQHF